MMSSLASMSHCMQSDYDLAGVAGGGILGGVHSLRERRPDLKEEQ